MLLSCSHEIFYEEDDHDDRDKRDNRRQGDNEGVGVDIQRESSLFQFLLSVQCSSHYMPEQV